MSVIALFEFKALPGRLKEFESKPMQAKSHEMEAKNRIPFACFAGPSPGPILEG